MRALADVVAAENAERVRGMEVGSCSASGLPIFWSARIDAELRLNGRVFLVEPVGPITYVDVNVGGWAVRAVADPDQPIAGRQRCGGWSSRRVGE